MNTNSNTSNTSSSNTTITHVFCGVCGREESWDGNEPIIDGHCPQCGGFCDFFYEEVEDKEK